MVNNEHNNQTSAQKLKLQTLIKPDLFLHPNLSLPHIVKHCLDHGEQDPPDQEGGRASAFLACVPGEVEGGAGGGAGAGVVAGTGAYQEWQTTSRFNPRSFMAAATVWVTSR